MPRGLRYVCGFRLDLCEKRGSGLFDVRRLTGLSNLAVPREFVFCAKRGKCLFVLDVAKLTAVAGSEGQNGSGGAGGKTGSVFKY